MLEASGGAPIRCCCACAVAQHASAKAGKYNANLTANFARREVGGVDIDIATPALEQLHQRVEVTCWQALRGEPDHISARDRPGYGSAARRARLGSRTVVQVGAEKYGYASGRMNLAEVDMRLRDRRAQAGERLLEGDRAGFLIQIKLKRASAVGGEDGCWGFVESDHFGRELLGIDRCIEQHEGGH